MEMNIYMLTNNYYAILINSQINLLSSENTVTLPLVSITGSTFSPSARYWERLEFGVAPKGGYSNIIFGDGIIQPTRGDTKLSGKEIEELEIEIQSGSYKNFEDKVIATKQLFIKNSGIDSVTVNEIGWTANIQEKGSSLNHTVLLDRTTLETPITIPAGKQAQINYTISWERGS